MSTLKNFSLDNMNACDQILTMYVPETLSCSDCAYYLTWILGHVLCFLVSSSLKLQAAKQHAQEMLLNI